MLEKHGDIRSCKDCLFIFDKKEYDGRLDCPVCFLSSVDAYHLYGKKTLKFKDSQYPFKQKIKARYKDRAIKDINSGIDAALETKRDIVKQKLNISSNPVSKSNGALAKNLYYYKPPNVNTGVKLNHSGLTTPIGIPSWAHQVQFPKHSLTPSDLMPLYSESFNEKEEEEPAPPKKF